METVEPFLDLEVLDTAAPQGFTPVSAEVRSRLGLAVEELRSEPGKASLFIDFVLREVLEWDLSSDTIARDAAVPAALSYRPPNTGETLRPDLVVRDGDRALLLVSAWPAEIDLERAVPGRGWPASPVDRMVELCRATGQPVGLVTNGWRWAVVHAPKNLPTGVGTFDSEIWVDEPSTLAAFADLLGAHRWFSLPPDVSMLFLLDRSANREEAVTGQLGAQVRDAVEHLVDALSRSNRETGGHAFAGITPQEDMPRIVYRGAVTATMRMVFLLFAEDRGLLPISDQLYAESYAIHTLFDQLRADADRLTEDVLERRATAWFRLLATSRAVHRGVQHDALRLPPYGGALFDPDRFPWLGEVSVDDRTMLRVLDALLVLRRRGRGSIEAQRLSYRSLDVEQIGHVYEGLLDHSGVRATDTVLPLLGPAQPEIALSTLEEQQDLVGFLVAAMALGSKRKVSTVQVERWLSSQPDAEAYALLRAACGGDDALTQRVLPYWGVLRPDLRGGPLIYLAGAVYVTRVGDRRSAGAHYTPRFLAEEIVKHTLDPLCHAPGPREDAPETDWRVRPADELLKLRVVDMAMGSGAFLVSACRYLAELIVEAWKRDGVPADVPAGGSPDAAEERLTIARRLVAERCLYGVDRDEMAVDMAKLSMWLITLSAGRPFEFLDHALRCGDSLLGITSLDQLRYLHLDPAQGRKLAPHVSFYEDAAGVVQAALDRAEADRRKLEAIKVVDIRDLDRKAELLLQAEQRLTGLKLLADGVVAAALARAGRPAGDYELALEAVRACSHGVVGGDRAETEQLAGQVRNWLDAGKPASAPDRECFHWPLEFPEVFADGGFNAVVGNPPFQGGQRITGSAGTDYRDYVVRWLAGGRRGSADLVSYFFLRAIQLAPSGTVGLLATNTIAQGDTREVGLDQIAAAGWSVMRAVKSMRWPGEATVEVSVVWLGSDTAAQVAVLDGARVRAITSALDPLGAVKGRPRRLAANAGIAFQGSTVLGMGFTMTDQEAQELLRRDPRNADVILPYVNGEELNSSPDDSPGRWVINFRDWPVERARQYTDCFERIVRLVKPERERNSDRRRREIWWQFTRPVLDLYRAIDGLDRAIAIARVSKTVMPMMVLTKRVFTLDVMVFAADDPELFATLSSSFHYWWAIKCASTMKGDLRYTLSDVFETLPRPSSASDLRSIGQRLHRYRSELMAQRGEGLTTTYNRVHDPTERATDISALRAIHVEIDQAVASAYGWTDLALDHGFYETRQGMRYTVSPAASAASANVGLVGCATPVTFHS